ncbi:MAG: hypothetical protein J6N18_06380, partial [Kiritimatiellae bacterium]|nr:hypothetical protein [Kiritimatiellia bacterium]
YHLSGDARLPVKDVTLKNIHVENSLQASSAENVEGLVVQDVQEPNSCVAVAATPMVAETVLPVCTGWRFHRGDKPGAEGFGISGVGSLEMCNF